MVERLLSAHAVDHSLADSILMRGRGSPRIPGGSQSHIYMADFNKPVTANPGRIQLHCINGHQEVTKISPVLLLPIEKVQEAKFEIASSERSVHRSPDALRLRIFDHERRNTAM